MNALGRRNVQASPDSRTAVSDRIMNSETMLRVSVALAARLRSITHSRWLGVPRHPSADLDHGLVVHEATHVRVRGRGGLVVLTESLLLLRCAWLCRFARRARLVCPGTVFLRGRVVLC
ncbi:hypothetical protein SGLAM104S_04862 [Streptomyces glaucescens]